jgi:hypothetical protein
MLSETRWCCVYIRITAVKYNELFYTLHVCTATFFGSQTNSHHQADKRYQSKIVM